MGQEMEPCYIEVPGLAPTRAVPTRAVVRGAEFPGSAGHGTGQCRPCAWVHKDVGGCRNGANCNYCHLCPPGELRRRKREKWLVGAVVAPDCSIGDAVSPRTDHQNTEAQNK